VSVRIGERRFWERGCLLSVKAWGEMNSKKKRVSREATGYGGFPKRYSGVQGWGGRRRGSGKRKRGAEYNTNQKKRAKRYTMVEMGLSTQNTKKEKV